MSDNNKEENLFYQKALEAQGLYEPNMTTSDVKQLYETLNVSKSTAEDENEYREILSKTEDNYNKLTLLQNKSQEETDDKEEQVTKIKPEGRITRLKNTKKFFDEMQSTTFLFGPSLTKTLKVKKREVTQPPIFYHHPFITSLPHEKKAPLIYQYLQSMNKTREPSGIKEPIPWPEPITGDFSKKYLKPIRTNSVAYSFSDDEKDKLTQDFELSPENNQHDKSSNNVLNEIEKNTTTPKAGTSKMQLKRKIKKQADSDDDDPSFIPSNYTEDELVDKYGGAHCRIESRSYAKITAQNTITKDDNFERTRGILDVSEETNKIFDKLKAEDDDSIFLRSPKIRNPSSSTSISKDIDSSPDVTDSVFKRKQHTNEFDVHNVLPAKANTSRVPVRVTRQTNKSKSQDNINTRIPANNFYGKKNSSEVDIKTTKSWKFAKKTQCPICSQLFPESQIENHASRCEQYEKTDVVCEICDQPIAVGDIAIHKLLCLNDITENSVEPDTKSNRSGFLCSVCHRFIIDVESTVHASNCIATFTD